MKRWMIIFWLVCCTVAVAEEPVFYKGGDISLLQKIEDHGGVYRHNGQPKDPLAIFKTHGCNIMRLRIFHTPSGQGPLVNDLAYTAKLGRRIKDAGLKLLLNFHYSDTWADPGKQHKPAAWADLTFDQLEQAVFEHTRDVIAAMKRAGAMPDIVQVGNEIAPGMLWDTGRVGGKQFNIDTQWNQLAALLKAGVRGVRAGAGDAPVKIMIHIHCGGSVGATRWFFDNITGRGVQFDMIGLSFYPWWHGNFDDLQRNLAATAERYRKPIVVVETAYPWQANHPDPAKMVHRGAPRPLIEGIPPTPEGQKQFLSQLIALVRKTPGGLDRGVLWWAPEYIPAPRYNPGRNHLALFDAEGNAQPAISAFAN